MKKNEVQIGASYIAKVSGKLAEVRITSESRFGGWDAVNVATNKAVRIKSAQRLRAAAGKPKAKAEPPKAEQPKVEQPATKPASANPLLKAEAVEFADALNKASVEQLREALAAGTLPAKQRNRVEIALRIRTEPAKATPAEDVAKTVEAVETGDMTKGIEVPTAGKKTPAAKPAKADGKMSGLDAAAKVLAENGKPMSAGEIVEQMLAKGYWTTGGKTPAGTIYAAMLREAATKGSASRFAKVDRGQWSVTEAAKQAK